MRQGTAAGRVAARLPTTIFADISTRSTRLPVLWAVAIPRRPRSDPGVKYGDGQWSVSQPKNLNVATYDVLNILHIWYS